MNSFMYTIRGPKGLKTLYVAGPNSLQTVYRKDSPLPSGRGYAAKQSNFIGPYYLKKGTALS